MLAIVEAAKAPDYPADICLVISNKDTAAGLDAAEAQGVTAICVDHTAYESRADFESVLDAVLREHDIEFVVCAGFMRVLSPGFVKGWAGRLINIHPSLLPKYKGLHTHKRALKAGDTEHGCTVHWVNEGVDDGEIIAQAVVPIHPGDTTDDLASRVLEQELTLYPETLAKVLLQRSFKR
ncbi:phosphoribosylglycinamide formyltransferase [Litorimonas cladophorae]|uniref:Phosphoribosylglycinamide formyltransferase n=2 Tax=Litorimonas cladophorae TaxID=1220491 RepID=A0A918NBU3_9PROT|nr:phosphoribosylglycinamide formyltransferase [Litorimonas cladophorae]